MFILFDTNPSKNRPTPSSNAIESRNVIGLNLVYDLFGTQLAVLHIFEAVLNRIKTSWPELDRVGLHLTLLELHTVIVSRRSCVSGVERATYQLGSLGHPTNNLQAVLREGGHLPAKGSGKSFPDGGI
jgi:hypothetical protein